MSYQTVSRAECPVCHGDIDMGVDMDLDALKARSVVRHLGPMDAACRWFMESWADEERAILQRMVDGIGKP